MNYKKLINVASGAQLFAFKELKQGIRRRWTKDDPPAYSRSIFIRKMCPAELNCTLLNHMLQLYVASTNFKRKFFRKILLSTKSRLPKSTQNITIYIYKVLGKYKVKFILSM